ACFATGNCPTPAIMSSHAEQIQREIHSGTSDRGGSELYKYRRCVALLTDSLVWGHPRPHQSQAQVAWHRHVAFPGPSSYASAACCAAAHSGAGSGYPPTRLTTNGGARPAPSATRGWRTVRLRGVWH